MGTILAGLLTCPRCNRVYEIGNSAAVLESARAQGAETCDGMKCRPDRGPNMQQANLEPSGPTFRAVTDDRTCIQHGPMIGVEDHPSCPVVMQSFGLPTVCGCECHVCKRAWEAQGRPSTRRLREAQRGSAQ